MELEETIEPERARDLLGRHEAQAIDLRDPDDFQAGHAPGAAPVAPDGDPETAIERTPGEETDLPVLVFSEDGEKASEVAAQLRESGHEASAVAGGWQAWVGADLPEQPRDDEEYEGPDLVQPGVAGSSGEEEDGDGDEEAGRSSGDGEESDAGQS